MGIQGRGIVMGIRMQINRPKPHNDQLLTGSIGTVGG